MRRIALALVLALLVVPALAVADQNYTGGKGATWDCKQDPTVNINHGKGTYTFKGECKAININGGHNTLTIESVAALAVNGAANTITAGNLDAAEINGADNKITWKTTKAGDQPTVTTLGQNNTVTRRK